MRLQFALCAFVVLTLSIKYNFIRNVSCTSDFVDSCNGNYIIISTIDGAITALDIDTGQKCWSTIVDPEKFLSSSLAELEIHENEHRVFLVPSLDGSLFKYDGLNRVIQPLPVDVDSFIVHSPYMDSSTSVIGGKMKVIFGIHRLTGEVIYKCKIDGCNTNDMPFPENIIVVEEIIQCVNAIDSVKALKKWHFRVAELKMKLASQIFSGNTSFQNIKQNALVPRNFEDFANLDMYKVSLQNGFAGMINESSEDFSWLHKATCPITDAWYLRDNVLKVLDPFEKETGFFSMDMDNGKHSIFLFLGLYQDQMFIKKSKAFHVKNANLNSLSTNILYQNYLFPVCSNSENIVSVNDSISKPEDLTITYSMDYNVSDYGFFFYMNHSIAENATHCIINTTNYIIKYEQSIPLSYRIVVFIASCICVYILMHVLFYILIGKDLDWDTSTEVSVVKPTDNTDFRSRFHQDFELISVLGSGGFGIVMDAKNKIDDCQYAVKRICLYEQLNSSQYERVLREVKALAKLDHHGIVRYFNAWIEYPPRGWQEKKDAECNIDISSTTFSSESNVVRSKATSKSRKKSDLLKKIDQNPIRPFSSVDLDDVQQENFGFEFSKSNPRSKATSKPHKKSDLLKKIGQNPLKPFGDICFDDVQQEDFQFQGSDSNPSDSSEENSSSIKEKASGTSSDKPNSSLIQFLKPGNLTSSSSSSASKKDSDNSILFQNSDQKGDLKPYSAGDVKESFCDDNFVVFENSDKEVNVQTCDAEDSVKKSASRTSKSRSKKSSVKAKRMARFSQGYLYIQMQLCQRENLGDWLQEHSYNRDYNKVIEIFYEIVDAVHYVHNCGLMHRDLKPSNIYFSMEGAIKIGDFGLATSSEIERENTSDNQHQPNVHTSDIGTEFYMSPEQKRKQDYDYKTDIYSLGIIFFELLVPFQTGSERFQVLSRVRQLDFPKDFTETYKTESVLVQDLLQEEPKYRPTTSEIKQHPLLFRLAHK